jgi:hypothetical protein
VALGSALRGPHLDERIHPSCKPLRRRCAVLRDVRGGPRAPPCCLFLVCCTARKWCKRTRTQACNASRQHSCWVAGTRCVARRLAASHV